MRLGSNNNEKSVIYLRVNFEQTVNEGFLNGEKKKKKVFYMLFCLSLVFGNSPVSVGGGCSDVA